MPAKRLLPTSKSGVKVAAIVVGATIAAVGAIIVGIMWIRRRSQGRFIYAPLESSEYTHTPITVAPSPPPNIRLRNPTVPPVLPQIDTAVGAPQSASNESAFTNDLPQRSASSSPPNSTSAISLTPHSASVSHSTNVLLRDATSGETSMTWGGVAADEKMELARQRQIDVEVEVAEQKALSGS